MADRAALVPKEPCKPEPDPRGHAGHAPYQSQDDPTEHDKCADGYLPNDYWWPDHQQAGFGHDAVVSDGMESANYDAIRFRLLQDGPTIVAEIKANDWIKYNEFVRTMELQAQVTQINRHARVAASCKLEYWVRVKDTSHRQALINEQIAGRIAPNVNIDTYQACPSTRPPNPLPYPF